MISAPLETFLSDGITIAYREAGDLSAPPILLIHGFSSSSEVNWLYTGWMERLAKEGRRVIAIDNRGHGGSQRLYDAALYDARDCMAEDACRLLDYLDISIADVMGYSMGARISAFLSVNHPDRVRSVVFGGLGMGMVTGMVNAEEIAQGLEAPTAAGLTGSPRTFRAFAEQTRADRPALAACMRGSRRVLPVAEVARITMPALIAIGTKDDLSGSGADLAALLPRAELLEIPDRDHMRAVGDRVYMDGVVSFLERRP
jgi:pimeloyl-ACP methyl ester carboxylesterase